MIPSLQVATETFRYPRAFKTMTAVGDRSLDDAWKRGASRGAAQHI